MPPETTTSIRITPHVLRPHHVSLVILIVLTFRIPSPSSKPWSSDLSLRAMRFLIDEVSELATPRHFTDMVAHMRLGQTNNSDHKAFADALRSYPKHLGTPGGIAALFEGKIQVRRCIIHFIRSVELISLVATPNDELLNAPIERRSFLGLFSTALLHSFQRWCDNPNLHSDRSSPVPLPRSVLFPTSAEETEKTNTHPFAIYQDAADAGDYSQASEKLHQFFDQQFNEIPPNRGFRQHALLHLARLHFTCGSLLAGRKVLQEAIAVSRTNGDKALLEHCVALLRRYPTSQSARDMDAAARPRSSEMDMLWEIKSLITSRQPLSRCFDQVFRAIGARDQANSRTPSSILGSNEEILAATAAQAVLCIYAGCESLAEIEGNTVLTLSENGSDGDCSFRMLCQKAKRAAQQGRAAEALSLLLRPDTWCGLTVQQYIDWTSEVNNLLDIQSRRRQQTPVMHNIQNEQPSRTDRNFPVTFAEDQVLLGIHDSMRLQKSLEVSRSLHTLLPTLWETEYLGHYALFRSALLVYADLGLEIGMERKSLNILKSSAPQMMKGDNVEQRAYACVTLARAMIMVGNGEHSSLRGALQYLDTAEHDYRNLDALLALANVQGLKALLYDSLGMTSERDLVSLRHRATLLEVQGCENDDAVEHIVRIKRLVGKVGVAVASKHT